MKSRFAARLINGPFGDPGLYVGLPLSGRAILFDLGRLDRFPAADIIRIERIFVSHMHMDHFYGFDRVLRLFLSREATLHIYGPPGITDNVRSKLAGYTWNLVDGYSFALEVHEVAEHKVATTRFRATTGFKAEPMDVDHFDSILSRRRQDSGSRGSSRSP